MLTAWVRIPNLSVEYFGINFLNKIGSKIGKVLRIDRNITQAQRGQFTRLSVEIDLSKPLLSKFWLKGKIWRIQYEGLRMVCFKCGKNGHNEEDCPGLHIEKNDAMVSVSDQLENISIDINAAQSKTKPANQRRRKTMAIGCSSKNLPGKGFQGQRKPICRWCHHHRRRCDDIWKKMVVAKQSTPFFQANKGESGLRFSILQAGSKDISIYSPNQSHNTRVETAIRGEDNVEKIFPTVNLGSNCYSIQSQPKFNLGKKSNKSLNYTSPKLPNKTYQERKKASLSMTQSPLGIIDPNILKPVQKILPHTQHGKENTSTTSHSNPQDISLPLSFTSPHIQSTSSLDGIVPPYATQCDQPRSTPGENSMCRTSNGPSVPNHSDPPDPHSGCHDGGIDRAEPRATGVSSNNVTTQ